MISIFELYTAKWRDNPDLIRNNYLFDIVRVIAGRVFLNGKMHAEIWLGAEF